MLAGSGVVKAGGRRPQMARHGGEGVMEVVGAWVAVRRFENGGKVVGGAVVCYL